MQISHWDRFAEFCLWEMNSGGPDPQIPLVGKLSEDCTWEEKVWRAGMYVSVYNVPFAEAIWEHWSWKDVQANMSGVRDWLNKEWPKIITRFERRTVRRPEWMHEYINSYYTFMRNDLSDAIHYCRNMSPEERYLYFWDLSISKLKRFGRYVALKLLEAYRLYCDIDLVAPDIRPKDAWSPRTTLGELHPAFKVEMNSKDNQYIPMVNKAVEDTLKILWNEYDVKMDRFQLQVALCEYRESYHSKKQYPGRSHDSELGYWHKREALWGTQPYSQNMFQARKQIFPHQHLGEIQGWNGPRKECGLVLATHEYTWTDILFDYNRSMLDMSKPVWRMLVPTYES